MIRKLALVASILALAAVPSLSAPKSPADGQDRAAAKSASKLSPKTTSLCRKINRHEVAQSSVGQSTTSNTFVDVIDSAIVFDAGGTGNSCVLVDFQAQVFAPGFARILFVQAVLDGVTVSADGVIQLQADSHFFSNTHGYNFIFPNVSPGIHTVKIQYASSQLGNPVFINDFNMVLTHR